MLSLTLSEKGGETKHLDFDKDEITIGRVQGNDIVLPKGNVSKRHCRIFDDGGTLKVEDFKSTNGTYINGRKITDVTTIGPADKVYVGDFIVKFGGADDAALAPPPPPPPPPAVPEAGSLGAAIPRRPPPPPPRGSASFKAITEIPGDDDDSDDPSTDSARKRPQTRPALPPPPPPPPGRRDTAKPMPAFSLDDEEAPPSPGAVDDDVDDDVRTAPPKLVPPPLRPSFAGLGDDDAASPTAGFADGADTGDVKTSSKARAIVPPSDAPPTSADALASWLIEKLRSDSSSSSLSIGPGGAALERRDGREPLAGTERSPVGEALRILARKGSPRPAAEATTFTVVLPEGYRLVAVFPPVAAQPVGLLSKTGPSPRKFGDLVADGVLSKDMREVLEACVSTRRNVLVAGDAHGTSMVLGALAAALPGNARVVSLIEHLDGGATSGWMRLIGGSRSADLVFTGAALAPDFLIADLTSGPVASDLLVQGAVGQQGLIVTMAARSASDALARFAALAGGSIGSVSQARELLGSVFDAIVFVGRLADGSVRVLDLAEPTTDAAESLFTFKLEAGATDGRLNGRFQATAQASSRLGATLTSRGASVAALARR